MSPRCIGAGVLLGSYEPGSDEWFAARQGRLGASEIAAVLGLSKWQSPFSLWHLKAGNIPPEFDKPEMEWGRDLEALIARRFDRNHVGDGWRLSRCGLYANRNRPYQVAQPDRVLHLGDRRLAALEVKTDRYADEWGEPGTDDIPVYYRCQALWQMDTFGWDTCHFAVLITGMDYREYIVRYDTSEVLMMRAAAHRFLDWLTTGTPPDIDEHTATYQAVRRLHPDVEDTDTEISERLATDYVTTIADHATTETRKRLVTTQIMDAMGNARRAVCNGTRIAIRVPGRNGATPHLRPASLRKVAA